MDNLGFNLGYVAVIAKEMEIQIYDSLMKNQKQGEKLCQKDFLNLKKLVLTKLKEL